MDSKKYKPWGMAVWIWVCLCSVGASVSAHAGDKPFLRLETATVEHDDENNFEISALVSRTTDAQTRQYSLEYNVSPTLGFEVEFATTQSRTGPEHEHEFEVSWRHVWVDHNRDDWGLALKLSAGWAREMDDVSKEPWRFAGTTAVAAFVLPLAEKRVFLHANAGVNTKRADGTSRGVYALGAEFKALPTLSVFAELAGRATEDRVQHAGLRWWVKREKMAVQLSSSRTKDLATGDSVKGVHLGLTFSDLSF